jgi:hypothetical protein
MTVLHAQICRCTPRVTRHAGCFSLEGFKPLLQSTLTLQGEKDRKTERRQAIDRYGLPPLNFFVLDFCIVSLYTLRWTDYWLIDKSR